MPFSFILQNVFLGQLELVQRKPASACMEWQTGSGNVVLHSMLGTSHSELRSCDFQEIGQDLDIFNVRECQETKVKCCCFGVSQDD